MTDYIDKPIPFKTEDAARQHAATVLADKWLMIIHSPHPENTHDYFIDHAGSMIRSWEKLLFLGKGRHATMVNRRLTERLASIKDSPPSAHLIGSTPGAVSGRELSSTFPGQDAPLVPANLPLTL